MDLPASIIRLNMGTGKLYRLNDNQSMADIDYQLYQRRESTEWSSELTLSSSLKISESEIYVIELEDGLKFPCKLRRKVNRAVSGIPPRYTYHATSLGRIE